MRAGHGNPAILIGTGWVVRHFSYAPIFLVAGLMHPLSILLLFWLLPVRYFSAPR